MAEPDMNNSIGLTVKLKEGVTSINNYAFAGSTLVKVEIPSTVNSISSYAFSSVNIKELDFSATQSLTTIGDSAFSYLTGVPVIKIPNSVATLGASTFRYSSLSVIDFGETLKILPQDCCSQCSSLTADHRQKTAW